MAENASCPDAGPHGAHGWPIFIQSRGSVSFFCPGVPDMAAEEAARMALALGGFTFQDITPQHWRD
jgi:hypothetical protein